MPDSASSEAVGSSARTSAGWLTSARAMATRCFWPPERAAGRWLIRSPSPSLPRISTQRSFISWTEPGRRAVAIRTFSIAVSELNRLCCWKMKPMFLRSSTRAFSLASERFWSSTSRLPSCIRRSAPMSVSKVDLPEPEGPVMITTSPRLISRSLSKRTWVRVSPAPYA